MREIKFRAWDINTNWMYFPDKDCFIDKLIETESWKPMQFTGLKDKNGKEIFEGDIVVWHDSSENVDRGWSRTAIVRINPDLYFQCFKVGGKPHDHDFHYGNFIWKETDKYFEVIGNIYENPELLK